MYKLKNDNVILKEKVKRLEQEVQDILLWLIKNELKRLKDEMQWNSQQSDIKIDCQS